MARNAVSLSTEVVNLKTSKCKIDRFFGKNRNVYKRKHIKWENSCIGCRDKMFVLTEFELPQNARCLHLNYMILCLIYQ